MDNWKIVNDYHLDLSLVVLNSTLSYQKLTACLLDEMIFEVSALVSQRKQQSPLSFVRV